MNVKELKNLIDKLPDDMPVIIASDEEGNGFSHFDGYSISHYTEDDYEVDIHNPEDIEDRKRWAESDQEDYVVPPKAFVLWP